MELRQPVASLKLHGLFGFRVDSFLFPEEQTVGPQQKIPGRGTNRRGRRNRKAATHASRLHVQALYGIAAQPTGVLKAACVTYKTC